MKKLLLVLLISFMYTSNAMELSEKRTTRIREMLENFGEQDFKQRDEWSDSDCSTNGCYIDEQEGCYRIVDALQKELCCKEQENKKRCIKVAWQGFICCYTTSMLTFLIKVMQPRS